MARAVALRGSPGSRPGSHLRVTVEGLMHRRGGKMRIERLEMIELGDFAIEQ